MVGHKYQVQDHTDTIWKGILFYHYNQFNIFLNQDHIDLVILGKESLIKKLLQLNSQEEISSTIFENEKIFFMEIY